MEVLIVIFYCIFFSLWIWRSGSAPNSGPDRRFLLAVFLIKVVLGISYGLIYQHWYQTGDVLRYFQDSKIIYNCLPENPANYLELTFGYTADGSAPAHIREIYDSLYLRWRTPEYTMVRINALLNLFTFGSFYANVVWICAAVVFGQVLFYRLMARTFPDHHKISAVGIFLLPSVLFWCSGVHKDSITLITVCILLSTTHHLLHRGNLKQFLLFSTAAFLLFITRSYVLILLLPSLAAYAWCLRRKLNTKSVLLAFAFSYILFTSGALILSNLSPGFDLLGKMAFEQQYLLSRKGNTHLPMYELEPSFVSLIRSIPMAADHVFLKPFTWRPQHIFQWASAAENLLEFLLLLFCLIKAVPRKLSHPLLILCILFSTSLLLLIGVLIPALGAIVRYKAVAMPFLYVSLMVTIPASKFPAFLRSN